jgi:CRISPR-associated protein Cas2
MSRRRFLIAYDISDDRRLRRVIKIMESYGQRLQYSVFLCDLSRAEELSWRQEVLATIELRADSVVVIDLGADDRIAPIECLGVPRQLPRPPGTIV